MKRILLVGPLSDNEALWVTGEESVEVKNNFPPLGLATVAALTPTENFSVQLWDENVHGLLDDQAMAEQKPDLVGVTGYKHHLGRCCAIAKVASRNGSLAAIGGPGVSGSPYDYRDDFDILFINEVENTWGDFLNDWLQGNFNSEYRQIEKPDLAESPIPCWDSIASDMNKYAMGTVQTTRGCPFDCEFCDVIYLFGRRPRHKPLENVLEEVRMQAAFGLKSIFLCDDEFSGNRRYAKALLSELIDLNKELPEPLTFSTQMSIAISRDEEFLQLLADANFDLVFMGIESSNSESLKNANKKQNLKGDMIENIHRVLSYGIGIRAGMIVGFDDDNIDIFEQQYHFIQESCLTSVAINMLKAPLGTPLWIRMMREGRVIDMAKNKDLGHARTYTNILPKRLSRVELLKGYRELSEKVFTWDSFADRVCGYVSLVKNPPAPTADIQVIDAEWILAKMQASPKASTAVNRIVEHTLQHAPGLMGKVKTLILQHASYFDTIVDLLPQLDRQIERETEGDVILAVDSRATPPPVAFRSAFDKVFPEVYRRVYFSISDLDKISHCLTEVFLEFLVRWGQDFTGLESYHYDFLNELADKICAKINNVSPENFKPCIAREGELPNYKRLRLADDIYKNVWIELAELQHSQVSIPVVNVTNSPKQSSQRRV